MSSENPFVIPPSWQFLSLKEILESPPAPEPPWKVRNLVAQGCGTQVSAHPHGMKSFTWLQAAIEAPLGKKVWDHFPVTEVKRTLFLETEDPKWMLMERVQHLANGLGIKASDVPEAGCFVLGCLGPFDLVAMERNLKSAIEKYQPDFTVLSTLQGLLAGRDWTKQDQMGPVNSLIVDICSHYSPLVTITHSPWDKRQQRAAGTITQAANFPTTCHYQKYVSKGETFAAVTIDSKLGAEEPRFKLHLKNGTPKSVHFVYERASQKAEITAHIKEHPKQSAQEISDQFGISERYARSLKKDLS